MNKKQLLTFCALCLNLLLYGQKNEFVEQFKNNKNKWALNAAVKKDSAIATIEKEQFVVDNKQEKMTLIGIKLPNKKININVDEEVTVSANLTHIGGEVNKAYSLLIGDVVSDSKFSGYVFCIAANGNYTMYISTAAGYSTYVKWTKSNLIKQGNATNTITIVKKRNQFHFLINGQWIFNIANANIPVNGIGMTISGKQKVGLDDIKIESFTKITNKKEQDKINDITTILTQCDSGFAKAANLKSGDYKLVTWLPYINEGNKNETILFGTYNSGSYEDNWSYPKPEADNRVKQYISMIEKAMGKFEKVERPNVLGKKTYWLNRNPKFSQATYILLDEFEISGTYFLKFVVKNDKDMTKEKIEQMK